MRTYGDTLGTFVLGALAGTGLAIAIASSVERSPRSNPTGNVKVIGGTGDVDPLEHGGGVVYKDDYGLHWEWWDEPEGDDYVVYRADVPDDVTAYFDWADWNKIGDYVDESAAELVREGKSSNVMHRVYVMRDLAAYWGAHELDGDPLELTRSEMEHRWPHLA